MVYALYIFCSHAITRLQLAATTGGDDFGEVPARTCLSRSGTLDSAQPSVPSGAELIDLTNSRSDDEWECDGPQDDIDTLGRDGGAARSSSEQREHDALYSKRRRINERSPSTLHAEVTASESIQHQRVLKVIDRIYLFV